MSNLESRIDSYIRKIVTKDMPDNATEEQIQAAIESKTDEAVEDFFKNKN